MSVLGDIGGERINYSLRSKLKDNLIVGVNSDCTLFPDCEPLKDSPFSDGADLNWNWTEKEARDPQIVELFYAKAPGT